MRKILITDCDGTLTTSSAILMFIGYLIDNNIIPDSELRREWENDMKNEELIIKYAEHFKQSIKGMDIDYLEKLATDFIETDSLEFYKSSMEIMKKAINEGYRVYIISGSCDFLIKALAKKFGVEGFGSVYGTDKVGRLTGNVDLPMFLSSEKKKIIEKLIFEGFTEHVIGMGDTTSDISIALASDEYYLVSPTAYTVNEYNKYGIDFKLLV